MAFYKKLKYYVVKYEKNSELKTRWSSMIINKVFGKNSYVTKLCETRTSRCLFFFMLLVKLKKIWQFNLGNLVLPSTEICS